MKLSPRWLTAKSAQQYTGLSHSRFYRLRKVARWSKFPEPAVVSGSTNLWKRSDLDAWMDACEAGEIDLSKLSEWCDKLEAEQDAA